MAEIEWGGIKNEMGTYYSDEQFMNLRERILASTKESLDYDDTMSAIKHEFQHFDDDMKWGEAGFLALDAMERTTAEKLDAAKVFGQLNVIKEARAIRTEIIQASELVGSQPDKRNIAFLFCRLSSIAESMIRVDNQIDDEDNDNLAILEVLVKEILSGKYQSKNFSEHFLGVLVLLFGEELIEISGKDHFINLGKIVETAEAEAPDSALVAARIMYRLTEIVIDNPIEDFFNYLASEEVEQRLDYYLAVATHKILSLPADWDNNSPEDMEKSRQIASSLAQIEIQYPELKA